MLRLSLDGLLSFSVVPLRLAIAVGFVVSVVSFAYLLYTLVIWWTVSGVVHGWASTVGMLSLLGGIQLVTLGVVGEYLGRLFLSSLNRPAFVVREQTGVLRAAAARHGVRVETVETDADAEVARYASLLLTGTYAAEYLRVGLVED